MSRVLVQARRIATDACGIPLKQTWSLRELISSYPSPVLSSSTFRRLHELSALIPPKEGTLGHDTTKKELEELVKLVEAVKLIDLDYSAEGITDGRVWVKDTGIDLSKEPLDKEIQGTRLLACASQTLDSMYVIETDRVR